MDDPTHADIKCIVSILNKVADEGSWTAFEPEDRYNAIHAAMISILDVLGLAGDEIKHKAHQALSARRDEELIAKTLRESGRAFRVGRKVDRNVYFGEQPLFVAASPDQAAEIVGYLNAGRAALTGAISASDQPERPTGVGTNR